MKQSIAWSGKAKAWRFTLLALLALTLVGAYWLLAHSGLLNGLTKKGGQSLPGAMIAPDGTRIPAPTGPPPGI